MSNDLLYLAVHTVRLTEPVLTWPTPIFRWADSALAHLSIRQPDLMIGSLDQRVGKFARQLVISGFTCQRDRVIRRFSSITPSVDDGEDKKML
jgi:hypothetical protein